MRCRARFRLKSAKAVFVSAATAMKRQTAKLCNVFARRFAKAIASAAACATKNRFARSISAAVNASAKIPRKVAALPARTPNAVRCCKPAAIALKLAARTAAAATFALVTNAAALVAVTTKSQAPVPNYRWLMLRHVRSVNRRELVWHIHADALCGAFCVFLRRPALCHFRPDELAFQHLQ